MICIVVLSTSFQTVARSGENQSTPANAEKTGLGRIDHRGIEQVWVPAGTFFMGTSHEDIAEIEIPTWATQELPAEMPRHKVRISKGFWMDRYETTNREFLTFVNDNGYQTKDNWSQDGWKWLEGQKADSFPIKCVKDEAPDEPRVCVTWFEAEAYAKWRGGRLPYEAEWEYAARGPKSLLYPWGNEFDPKKANVVDSKGLTPVGSFPSGASWVGAFDMCGNAMEWVEDWLSADYYESSPEENPKGPPTGIRKVEKGGWWGSNPVCGPSRL